MPRKSTKLDADDLIRRYTSGESLYQLATTFHVGKQTIKSILEENGVSIRNLAEARMNRRIPLDSEDILRRYLAGETKKAIAESLGVNQATVQRRLADFGITTAKNRSEAMKIRLSRMTPEERKALAEAANKAARGSKRSFQELCNRAKGVQEKGSHISKTERILAGWLLEKGISVIHQQAVGPYNIDLGAYPVAVEVFGGNWHATGKHAARLPERVNYLFNRGWNILIIWVNAIHHPLLPCVTDDIIAFIEQSRSNPSFRRQYRVIWGDGQFYSAGSGDDNNLALIPSGKRGQWSRATN